MPAISNNRNLTWGIGVHRCLKAESRKRESQGNLAGIKPEQLSPLELGEQKGRGHKEFGNWKVGPEGLYLKPLR